MPDKNQSSECDSAASQPFRWTVPFLTAALLCGNVLYFAGIWLKHVDRLTWQQWIFRLDFRYWPFKMVYVLWFIFVWLLVDALTFRQRRRPFVDEDGKANSVRVVVLVVKLAVLAAFLLPLLKRMRLHILRYVFMEYYFQPLAGFFHEGTLSWKLGIAPLAALLVILALLQVKKRFRPQTSSTEKLSSHPTP